jgi:hypothetical protein
MPLTILSGNPTGSFEETQDSAVKIGNPEIFNMPAPLSVTGATTLTPQQFINGIVVASGTFTLTLAPIRDAPGPPVVPGIASLLRVFSSRGIIPGDTISCLIVNGGAGTITLSVAGATGLAFDTNQTTTNIVTGASKLLMLRFTVGTPGSEAATIYA